MIFALKKYNLRRFGLVHVGQFSLHCATRCFRDARALGFRDARALGFREVRALGFREVRALGFREVLGSDAGVGKGVCFSGTCVVNLPAVWDCKQNQRRYTCMVSADRWLLQRADRFHCALRRTGFWRETDGFLARDARVSGELIENRGLRRGEEKLAVSGLAASVSGSLSDYRVARVSGR